MSKSVCKRNDNENKQYTKVPSSLESVISSELNIEDYSRLSETVILHYGNERQSLSLLDMKTEVYNYIRHMCRSLYGRSNLYLSGSTLNGLSSNMSDIDMCWCFPGTSLATTSCTQRGNQLRREEFKPLRQLQRCLNKCELTSGRAIVIFAKIPIVKFRFKHLRTQSDSWECDVNLNQHTCIRNTHLIRSYVASDERVGPFMFFIKTWAKSQGINCARQQTLSSYSLCLMAIFYLQANGVLPVLHDQLPSVYDNNRDIDCVYNEIHSIDQIINRIHFISKNKKTSGELFVDFLKFYAYGFDFENCVISVRKGEAKSLETASSFRYFNKALERSFIKIEDPFDHNNTARAVDNRKSYNMIRDAFTSSYLWIVQTKSIDDFIETSEKKVSTTPEQLI